jgi:putative nucleotidyltransferase with HDIG domain
MVAPPNYTSLIVDLSRNALVAASLSEALSPMLEALVTRTGADAAVYIQSSGDVFVEKASAGNVPDAISFLSIATNGVSASDPLIQAVGESCEPLVEPDLSEPASRGSLFFPFGVKSIIAVRVTGRLDEFLGVVLLFSYHARTWSSDEVAFTAALVGSLSGAAARVAAEEKASHAREGAIRALGLALEYRDRETKGHTDRVTALSVSIARQLGLSEQEREYLRWGAYLHDIGKISVPDSILLKPSSLSGDEWDVMKSHSVVGYEFARQLGFLPNASLDVVRFHHEKWDGSGYPDGLRGDAIPLGGRIFAVADVFDALMSARPYKKAWSLGEAREEILKYAGTHFDREVVQAFLQSGSARSRDGARSA